VADEVVTISSEYAPKGAVPFIPQDSNMEFELVPIEETAPYVPYVPENEQEYFNKYEKLLPDPKVVTDIPKVISPKITVIFDTETTGVDKFTSRLVVCTLWDISKPKSEMMTFSGWDEELLVREIADWLNKVNPGRLVAYNITFDMIFLLSRFMLYKIPVKCWASLEPYDMMDVLSKGTEKYSDKDTKVGKAEEWFFFLFGETKPYMIEECLADLENGDLTKMIVRNRVCVGSEGDMYALLQHVLTGTEKVAPWEQVPLGYAEEAEAAGEWTVQCTNCLTGNVFKSNGGDQYCFLCGTLLDGDKVYDPAMTRSISELESKYLAAQIPDWGKIKPESEFRPLSGGGQTIYKGESV
jgi:hypothetical protein